MRFERLFIAGHGVWLPPALPTERAVDDHLWDLSSARRSKIASVRVAAPGRDQAPPRMAARAATQALARSGLGSADIDLLLHATVHAQGRDLWNPAAYVQREVLCNRCPAIEVRQLSNGGMAALELAAGYLNGSRPGAGALLTAADRFSGPGFDRWQRDPGAVYSDGGAALVLSTVEGYARVVSVATFGDTDIEGFDPSEGLGPTYGVDDGNARFIGQFGLSTWLGRRGDGLGVVLRQVLSDAGVELSDVDWFVLPNLGHGLLDEGCFQPYGIDAARSTWEFGRTVGHLGAADQFAGLDHLVESGRAQVGDRVLLVGAGGGFTWSAAVVEVLREPRWVASLAGAA